MNVYKYVINKYKINVGHQYIVEIPNMGRKHLAGLFKELEFNYGVEVGVEQGRYSEVLCKANPKLKLFCVDPWSAGAYDSDTAIHAVDTEQSKYNERYAHAKKRLKLYNATLVRKPSMEALDDFKDNSLDFVYIDANHDFPNFINDLHEWIKKVKEDGIVSGHDWAHYSFKKYNHVKRALEAYSRSYRMQPLFVVGTQEYGKIGKPSPNRDKYRSWFWVKKKGGLR